MEPWSSYLVLPLFALANAGLPWSSDVLAERGRLVTAIVLALVLGKFAGILFGARLAVRLGFAIKPATYSWRQVAGTGALAGIGFTMSLFIAAQALTGADYAAAKVAIFIASLAAGALGMTILWPRVPDEARSGVVAEGTGVAETGTPVGRS